MRKLKNFWLRNRASFNFEDTIYPNFGPQDDLGDFGDAVKVNRTLWYTIENPGSNQELCGHQRFDEDNFMYTWYPGLSPIGGMKKLVVLRML